MPTCPPMRRSQAYHIRQRRTLATGTPAGRAVVCGPRTRPRARPGPRTRRWTRPGPRLGRTSAGQRPVARPPGLLPLRRKQPHRTHSHRTPAPSPRVRRMSLFLRRPRPWQAGRAAPSSRACSIPVPVRTLRPERLGAERPLLITLRRPRQSPAEAASRACGRVLRPDLCAEPVHQPAPRRDPAPGRRLATQRRHPAAQWRHRAKRRPGPAARRWPAAPPRLRRLGQGPARRRHQATRQRRAAPLRHRPYRPLLLRVQARRPPALFRGPPIRCQAPRPRRPRAARTFPVWPTARPLPPRPARAAPPRTHPPARPSAAPRQAVLPRQLVLPRQAVPRQAANTPRTAPPPR